MSLVNLILRSGFKTSALDCKCETSTSLNKLGSRFITKAYNQCLWLFYSAQNKLFLTAPYNQSGSNHVIIFSCFPLLFYYYFFSKTQCSQFTLVIKC